MLDTDSATAEVEAVEPPTIDDTLRETLASIRERNAEEAPETDAPTRSEAGKFAEKTIDAAPEVEPETAKPPPSSWKKEVAAKWNTLPPDVREEVERREANMHDGLAQYREAAQVGQSFNRAVAPYMATLQGLGLTPEKAVGELMAADHRLRYGQPEDKLAFMQHLAKSYGIDIGQLQNFTPQQVDPTVSALQQQVEQLTGYLQQREQNVQQQANDSLQSEIAAFAADPAHGHYPNVKRHMAALLQEGLADTLEDAYTQAVYANPQTRGAMAEQQLATQRQAKAAAAQNARITGSTNIRSRPALATESPAGATIEETLRNNYRRLMGN